MCKFTNMELVFKEMQLFRNKHFIVELIKTEDSQSKTDDNLVKNEILKNVIIES